MPRSSGDLGIEGQSCPISRYSERTCKMRFDFSNTPRIGNAQWRRLVHKVSSMNFERLPSADALKLREELVARHLLIPAGDPDVVADETMTASV